jgi:glycosyltransferase involved in cell wall biosynthesis
MMKLPITALLPIFNCRERLERHLRSVVTWADSVEEIIVVDSGSSDGTIELAKEALTPFAATFLHNPPGLYQSWNAGIAAATAPWCYISTVEDPISHEGISHLLEVVSRHDADLVISPPEMRNHDGSAPVEEKMPSTRLADSLRSAGLTDRLLTRAESISMLCGFLPHGLLGSSASNLYRTTFLQQHPFPTDFGHCGDTAWGVKVSPLARIAFTPHPCAQFYCQTNFRAEAPQKQLARHRQLAELARTSLTAQAPHDPEVAVMLGWFDAQDYSTQTLWNWLAEQHTYQEHLQAKYEGGIIQYLKRALRDEWKKLQDR